MEQPTVVNPFGTMKGWNSITVNLLGRNVKGITGVSYSDTVAKENVYGAGGYPIGRSEGNYEAEAALTLFKEETDALKLSLPRGKRLQDIAPFDIVVVYKNTGGVIMTDIIRNCEFTNDGIDVSQSDGSIATEYTLIISHIDWNVAA